MCKFDRWSGLIGYGLSLLAIVFGDKILKLLGMCGLALLYGRHCVPDIISGCRNLRSALRNPMSLTAVLGRSFRENPYEAVHIALLLYVLAILPTLIDIIGTLGLELGEPFFQSLSYMAA